MAPPWMQMSVRVRGLLAPLVILGEGARPSADAHGPLGQEQMACGTHGQVLRDSLHHSQDQGLHPGHGALCLCGARGPWGLRGGVAFGPQPQEKQQPHGARGYCTT